MKHTITKPSLGLRLFVPLALVAATFLVACSDSEDEPGTPVVTPPATASETPQSDGPSPTVTSDGETPTAEPATATAVPGETAEPGECPIEAIVCNLADSIEVALEDGNYDIIVDLVQSREETCPGGTPQGAGGPFPLCEGATQGEVRTGYQMGRRYSEGFIGSREQAVVFLQAFVDASSPDASDDYGTGDLRLVAVSCVEEAGGCSEGSIIFTAILDGTRREVLVFTMPLPADPEAPITLLRNGIVMDDEAPLLFETGGEVSGLGKVYVLPE